MPPLMENSSWRLGVDRILRKWNVDTGALTNSFSLPIVGSRWFALFSNDSSSLLVSAVDGSKETIRLWNISAEEPVAIDTGCELVGRGGCISRNGQQVAFLVPAAAGAAAEQADVYLWEAASRSTRRICAARFDEHFLISPDGTLLAFGSHANRNGGENPSIRICDLTVDPPRERLVPLPTERKVRRLSFSPDGQTVAAGDDNGQIFFVPIAPGQPPYRVAEPPTQTDEFAFSPDNRLLACRSVHNVGNDFIYSLSIFDRNCGQCLRSWKTSHSVNGIAFAADNQAIIVGSNRGLELIAVDDIPVSKEWKYAAAKEAWSVAYSPSRETLAVAGEPSWLRFLDPVTGKELKQLNCRPNVLVSCIAWSPDGEFLVSGDYTKTAKGEPTKNVRIWNPGCAAVTWVENSGRASYGEPLDL